jgi:hypothetical protein
MLRRAFAFVVFVASCSPGVVTQNAAQAPSIPGAECRPSSQSSRPLVVEWPSAERQALEAQAARQSVIVHYANCQLEVLRHCRAPGAYKFGGATRQDDRVAIKNRDELHANLPAYAAQLEGKLARAGSLDVDMSIVGAWVSDVADIHASMLEGDCKGATHVVSAMTVGAFEFGTKADATATASASFAGAGGGASSASSREILSRAGDRQACAKPSSNPNAPPEGCGAVVRLELRPLSGLSGAGATRCRIELGPAKCARIPTLPQSFDDAWEFADTKSDRCEQRARDWYRHCGDAEPVTARFYRDGKIERETTYSTPTRCQVTINDCPHRPEMIGTFNDDFETSSHDDIRCLQRADDFRQYCGGAEPVTAKFLLGARITAERTSSRPTRCQIVVSDCPRKAETEGIFNDEYQGADKDVGRCMRRAFEFLSWCGGSKPVSARYFEGATLVKEEKAGLASRCQITISDCPRQSDLAGVFLDDWEHADSDPDRCMRRSDEYRNHCGTGAPVTARFFRGEQKTAERVASSPTHCQARIESCPKHPESAAVFNDVYDGSDANAARCAKRASEYVAWCGGGSAVLRFYRGTTLEREQAAP